MLSGTDAYFSHVAQASADVSRPLQFRSTYLLAGMRGRVWLRPELTMYGLLPTALGLTC